MAQAKRLPTPQPVYAGVELTLTEDEAETLLIITRNIIGDVDSSRRKHTEAIGRVLREAGYEADWDIGIGRFSF